MTNLEPITVPATDWTDSELRSIIAAAMERSAVRGLEHLPRRTLLNVLDTWIKAEKEWDEATRDIPWLAEAEAAWKQSIQ